jgi:hypothetical protein
VPPRRARRRAIRTTAVWDAVRAGSTGGAASAVQTATVARRVPRRGVMSNGKANGAEIGMVGGRELLAVVERLEAQARRGEALDPRLLRDAARLLPSGGEAAALRVDLERLAAISPSPARRTVAHEVCTVADRNYLARALALVESLDRHQRGGHRVHFVCLDDTTLVALQRLAHPAIVPIPVRALEAYDPRLAAVRGSRSLAEYSWTLKASMILWVFERHPEAEVVTYLDGDLFFMSPLADVLDELGDGAALIHRHAFSPEHAHFEAGSGTYNAGFVAFRRDPRAFAVLRWWRDRCLEWCFQKPSDGRISGDQGYLNEWPSRFPGVVVARSRGIGVALWNHRNGAIGLATDGTTRFGGERIRFYHMHGFASAQPGVLVPSKDLCYRPTMALLRHCYLPYAHALDRAEARLRELSPGWSFGHGVSGVTAHHALLARRALREPLRGAGFTHRFAELDGEWDCLLGAQVLEAA